MIENMNPWKKYIIAEHFVLVDIGTFGIKLMEVKRKLKEYSIEKIFYLPEMNKYFKGKDLVNFSGVMESLLHIFQIEEIKTKNIILSFTSSKMQNKIIKLPDIPEKDMRNLIEIEFQKHFPNTSRMSDILDHMLVGKLSTNDQTGSMVLIATLPIRESTNVVQEIVSKKFNLKKIDVDTHALGISGIMLESEHTDKVVLNIGYETSQLVFIRDKSIVFSRPVNYGVNSLSKALQTEEDINVKEAEQILEENGLKATNDILVKGYKTIPRDVYNSIIDENLGNTLNDVYRVFQSVESTVGVEVKEIVLTGGFACLPHAEEITKANLDVNVHIWTIEKEATIPLPNGCRVKNNTNREINSTYATCFGMLLTSALY